MLQSSVIDMRRGFNQVHSTLRIYHIFAFVRGLWHPLSTERVKTLSLLHPLCRIPYYKGGFQRPTRRLW